MHDKSSVTPLQHEESELSRTPRQELFDRIVCGVDGSRTSRAAVEQAVTLAGPATSLQFICVRSSAGQGRLQQSTISARRADQAVAAATSLADKAGIDAGGRIVDADDPASALIEAGSGADLLVVASHSSSRLGGILLGSVATTAVHDAGVPVLVARSLPKGTRFPERVLVASDGSADAARAVELASRLARRHESRLYLLAAGLRALPHAEELGRHAAALMRDPGLEPTLLFKRGDPEDEIPRAAREEGAALVVIGSRGLSGARALGSVSESVSSHASCSVLVARPNANASVSQEGAERSGHD